MVTLANQSAGIYSLSPPSKRAEWQRKPPLPAAGSPDEPPLPYPCPAQASAWVAPTCRTLFPPTRYCAVVAEASEHLLPFEHILSKRPPPQFLQPNDPRAPTEHVPCESLLSGRFLLPPLLHRELGKRKRAEVSHALGTQPQGQAWLSRDT